ncbi:golgi transport complex subunit 5-domain-containing protein [Phanerochaete sordida]|uniref:Conserved oligomeric Golgi complex subunit 5 n=1 Tax=Phanerochaete sordida TaxID=48140 RepID=A0A9P3LFR8_9APHY|nr:golgi transport complex subunit 5-domain-containing protein [Phanerochaete sordida]
MTDYTVFAHPDFDPNDYANALLAGEPYPPTAGQAGATAKKGVNGKPTTTGSDAEDISVAISKLSFNIEDVEKQLKNVVTTHHEDLLVQAAGVTDLEGSLSAVKGGLTELDGSLDKLRQKIRTPYQTLSSHVTRLERVQQASDILRRTSRFVVLTRRLQMQLTEMDRASKEDGTVSASTSHATAGSAPSNGDVAGSARRSTDSLAAGVLPEEDEKERTIAKAALSIAELMALLQPPEAGGTDQSSDTPFVELSSVKAVAAYLPFVDSARSRVTSDMEQMVINGLRTLNQSLLASSLQTAHNLRVLPDLVQNLVSDLSDAVEGRIRYALDLTRIAKEVLPREQASAPTSLYKSRFRTEPTNVTAPQWQAALWASLESLVEEMADCCIKVYTLEKVLTIKKDAVTKVGFLDEAMKVLENKPSTTFWAALGQSLEKQFREAAKSSTFLQQTLSAGYPRLLRLFHSFFAKIAVHTDTAYSQAQQSPETILVLRALSLFESSYLTRSSTRINEAVGNAFAGGARSPPGQAEGTNVARAVANELDSAKFDPLLVKAVARNAATSLEAFVNRADSLMSRERNAVNLLGPMPTSQQVLNASLATCLYHSWCRLDKLQEEYPADIVAILKPSIESIHKKFLQIVDPLLAAVRREVGAIIAKLHRQDFSDAVDPMSAMGGGASPYMKDLAEKLAFVKGEVFALYGVPELVRDWVKDTAKYVIRTFLLHASLAKPLGETGKLQLTSDMTECEFALSAFMAEPGAKKRGADWESVGAEYRALRAMRQLLFLDNAQLASPRHTAGLPPLLVLHHILVRSPLALPHTLHGWAEAEYVRWVNEHTPAEACSLVEGGLAHWEGVARAEGTDTDAAREYVELARAVLRNAGAE